MLNLILSYLSGLIDVFPLVVVALKPPRWNGLCNWCSLSSRKFPEFVRIILNEENEMFYSIQIRGFYLPKILFNPFALEDLFLSKFVEEDFLKIEYFWLGPSDI